MADIRDTDTTISNIEDYVGGNIEGIDRIDRMAFTAFLRAELEQLIKKEQRDMLKMILQSAHDQEEASGRRWSRGTFIKAMTELIDDLEQEMEQ
jgi:hypothetical protein